MKNRITACIDGSIISSAVCDAAAWASGLLGAPVKLLHVLEKTLSPATEDLSGAIGLGSREHLLAELTELDARRNRLAVEHGKHILEAARQRSLDNGAVHVDTEQRHDQLLDALLECEADTRLYVVGRLGQDHSIDKHVIGSHIENVVRAIHTPVLMATRPFTAPGNYMLAYDGSDTADAAIERISTSPLLLNIPGHIVMVGDDDPDHRQQLERVCNIMEERGHRITPHMVQGRVIEALLAFQEAHNIQLKVMGAYGHSRIREFLVGSNTSRMLAASTVPALILR
ncbi:MAG: universal stress protein UspA [Halioglobus sp.]|nr:universal stress protein UspA [Halioglobus sp.]|tara:strand:- start:1977 stop:2831 length:855 start_codon:yes stop_codon:yes gene_type:complete